MVTLSGGSWEGQPLKSCHFWTKAKDHKLDVFLAISRDHKSQRPFSRLTLSKTKVAPPNSAIVFESQTLGYKPNPVSHEKSPKRLCQIVKKSRGLQMKKYGNTIACESGSNKVHSEETEDRKDLHGRVPFIVVITLHLSHSHPKDPNRGWR